MPGQMLQYTSDIFFSFNDWEVINWYVKTVSLKPICVSYWCNTLLVTYYVNNTVFYLRFQGFFLKDKTLKEHVERKKELEWLFNLLKKLPRWRIYILGPCQNTNIEFTESIKNMFSQCSPNTFQEFEANFMIVHHA